METEVKTDVVTEGQENVQGTENGIETGPVGTEEKADTTLPSDEDEFTMPEKFKGKTAEEIAKSYIELEKLKNSTKDTKEPEEETTPKEGEEDSEGDKYIQEFLETGKLSEESYKELEAKGIPKEEIDDRLDYERYKIQKKINDVVSVIGGIEEYNAMEAWAVDNKTEEERQAFVVEFQAAGPMAQKALLKDLYSQYKGGEAGGDMVHTNEPQAIKKPGYTSQHELQKDMADPRYGVDRSYTKAVEEKLARSKDFE